MDLDDLLKSIREEKDEEIPEGLDDLLSSIRGGEKKTIKAEKVVGAGRYQKYVDELAADGTIDGERLTTEERKEGFKKRNDKIGFKQFVDNVLDRKKAAEKAAAGGGEPPSPPGEGEEREPETDRSKLLPGTAEIQPKPIVDPSKLLPGQPESEQEKTKKTKARVKKDPMLEKLDAILKSTTSIEKLMAKDLKLDKQLADKERKRLEREKAEKKEKFRESFGKKLGGAVSKVMQPVKGIFDKILETIMSILLYAGLMRFLDWFSDPENQKKIKNLFRFLGKFWPALLALYLAFGNGFTKALLRMTGSLLKFVPKLVMIAAKLAFKAGKALLGAVMKNPLAAAGALVVGGTAIAAIKANQDDTAVVKDAKNPKKSHADEINEFGGMTGSPMGGLFSGGGLVPNLSTAGHPKHGTGGIVKGFSGGGPVPKSTSNSKNGGKNFPPKNRPVSFLSGGGSVVNYNSGDQISTLNPTFNLHMSSGGEVPGINAVFNPTINYLSGGGEPMGTDTVPAMLTPGEFVMSRGAVQKYGVKTLEEMNASGGGTNRPKVVQGRTVYASGGGSIEVKGTGNTVEGELTFKDGDGKRVGKKYLAISGTYAGQGISQRSRYNTRNAPMPDGNYKLVGFQEHGPWPGLPGIGHWSTYVNNSSGSIGSRGGLMLHNDIGDNGTLGCIGVGLGGRAGTKAEQEFLETYKQVKPQTMKVALGAGGGDASDIDAVDSSGGSSGGSSRSATPDNSSAAAQRSAASSGGTYTPMTGYRKDSAATLSPTQSRYSVNPLRRGSGMSSRGDKNAAELSQTAPSELSKSDAAKLASGNPAAPTTQVASPGRGTQSRRRSAEDPNNMILFSNRALHNIIL